MTSNLELNYKDVSMHCSQAADLLEKFNRKATSEPNRKILSHQIDTHAQILSKYQEMIRVPKENQPKENQASAWQDFQRDLKLMEYERLVKKLMSKQNAKAGQTAKTATFVQCPSSPFSQEAPAPQKKMTPSPSLEKEMTEVAFEKKPSSRTHSFSSSRPLVAEPAPKQETQDKSPRKTSDDAKDEEEYDRTSTPTDPNDKNETEGEWVEINMTS